MTARAKIEDDFVREGVAIYLGCRDEPGRTRVALPLPAIMLAAEPEDGGPIQPITEPTLRLPESMARALLDALAEHFGGVTDTRTLRQDYLAERARVDKLIAQVHDMTIAFARYIYDHPPG